MPKFYVRSDELEVVIDAPTSLEAARRSVLRASGQTIDHNFYVDERGFRGPKPSEGKCAVMADDAPNWAYPYNTVMSQTTMDDDYGWTETE